MRTWNCHFWRAECYFTSKTLQDWSKAQTCREPELNQNPTSTPPCSLLCALPMIICSWRAKKESLQVQKAAQALEQKLSVLLPGFMLMAEIWLCESLPEFSAHLDQGWSGLAGPGTEHRAHIHHFLCSEPLPCFCSTSVLQPQVRTFLDSPLSADLIPGGFLSGMHVATPQLPSKSYRRCHSSNLDISISSLFHSHVPSLFLLKRLYTLLDILLLSIHF